ncbi:MAG: hypothetical protein FE78DRAFT_28900 [Acidomyces sp. 'richmondensis']|nr:MAG: hypothetical protein FE78DRAFT_28900 [Acidomyces sp. 'richmondensis']
MVASLSQTPPYTLLTTSSHHRCAEELVTAARLRIKALPVVVEDNGDQDAGLALICLLDASFEGVPFEALLPYAIMLGMFGFSGAALSKIRHMQNGGKRGRHSVDQWDRQMMDRDMRLTGFLRGQIDNPRAPPGFELSNPWRVEKQIM